MNNAAALRIDSLTSLRFFACMIVVVYHYGKAAGAHALVPGSDGVGPWQLLTFFFVLSGFVLVLAYHRIPTFNWREFWLARAARVLPIYFVALLFSLWVVQRATETKAIVLAVTLLQTWVPGYATAVNGPGWSLSNEAAFYVIFPFLFVLFWRWRATPIKALSIATAVWLVTQVALTILLNSEAYTGYDSVAHHFIYYSPLAHFCSFLFGVAAAFYALNRLQSGQPAAWYWSPGLWVVIFLVVLELTPYMIAVGGYNTSIGSSALAPLLAVLVTGCVLRSNSPLSRVMGWPFVVFLGEITYSVYILQSPFHILYEAQIDRYLSLSPLWEFVLFMVLLLLLATATFLFIERPAQKWIRRLWRAKRPRKATA